MIAGYSTSKHLLDDRFDRVMHIATTVGFGEIAYKKPLQKADGWAVITTTGVLLVTDRHDSFIVTMYLVDMEQLVAIFEGNPPKEIKKIVKENMKKGYVR